MTEACGAVCDGVACGQPKGHQDCCEWPTKHRGNYLPHPQQLLLVEWCYQLHEIFTPAAHGPFLVGSAISRADYRDVDIRMMLDDADVDAIPVDLRHFNMALSLWGQQVTGLPIDFQVQRTGDANEEFVGVSHPRHAIWITKKHPPRKANR